MATFQGISHRVETINGTFEECRVGIAVGRSLDVESVVTSPIIDSDPATWMVYANQADLDADLLEGPVTDQSSRSYGKIVQTD